MDIVGQSRNCPKYRYPGCHPEARRTAGEEPALSLPKGSPAVRSIQLTVARLLKPDMWSKSSDLQIRPTHLVEVLPAHDQLRYAESIAPRQDDSFEIGPRIMQVKLCLDGSPGQQELL